MTRYSSDCRDRLTGCTEICRDFQGCFRVCRDSLTQYNERCRFSIVFSNCSVSLRGCFDRYREIQGCFHDYT